MESVRMPIGLFILAYIAWGIQINARCTASISRHNREHRNTIATWGVGASLATILMADIMLRLPICAILAYAVYLVTRG